MSDAPQQGCPECTTTAGQYCAPRRCYCNHDACPATYASSTQTNAATSPASNKWQLRDGPTWIDNL